MWYPVLRLIFKFIVWILARVEVQGVEHIPPRGPFILAVNHLTILEPPVLFVALPIKRVTVFAADKWEHVFFIGWLLRRVGAIFVNRGEVDRRALRAALKVLRSGGVLGIAPEGTRSKTGGLIRAKPGIAYLASLTNAPILPVGMSGQLHFSQQWRRLRRLHLRIRVGPLIHLPPVTGPDRMAQLQAHADRVMVAIARLVDPELRGIYASAVTEPESKPY
ncbi:MAG: 1-acyl-sn-glycerol-3-phosphate acyltransferase [Caldilineae bacterium]|nr:MAG: 1-acyl-sn-glycerol-3-phosphate acyltransferase [Caldilineae bacterium]